MTSLPIHEAGAAGRDGVSRRDFLAQSTMAAIATLLTSACGSSATGPSGGGAVNLTVSLANFPALANNGGIARVDGGSSTPVGVGRISATQYVAYRLACTHQGTTVVVSQGIWFCPNHGAQFAADGSVTQGPAAANLASLSVVLDQAAGTLTITG